MKSIQVKNNIINLDHVRKISYEKMPLKDLEESNSYNVEFTYSNGDVEHYEMTHEKFQHLIDEHGGKLAFVVDDHLNTFYAEEIK